MHLADYVQILRRGWRGVAVGVLAAVALGFLIIAGSDPSYVARAELFVAPGTDPGSQELVQGSGFYLDRVKTYAAIVDSALVLDPVIDELGLDETAQNLAARVSANAPLDTVLLQIRVTDSSPEQAAEIADAVAKRFTDVARQLESIDGTGNDAVVRVTVVQPANVPRHAATPNRRLIIGIAVILGLAAGFVFSVLKETLNTRVRSETELRKVTDLPVVGKIPRRRKNEPLMLTDRAANGPRVEAFRRLRTNLNYLDIGGAYESFVITSALPGEGKFVVAANLALAVARAGTSVCLVEADLRKPWTGRLLDLEPALGLSSVIMGTATVEEALVPWGSTGVDVLAGGPVPPNPSELLSSDAMDELLDELERRFELVIIDAPPLLAVTDAAIVARRCGGAIVVVSNTGRRTVTRDQLAEALHGLEAAGSEALAVVFNRQPTSGPDSMGLGDYAYSGSPRSPRPSRRRPSSAPSPTEPVASGTSPPS